MRRPIPGSTPRIRWLRWPWLLATLALLAAGWAMPAAAAGQASGATLTVSRLWNQGGRVGSWTPYVMSIRNDGPGTFTGTAALVPSTGYANGPQGVFPEYDAAVTVPAGSQRTVTVYVLETQSGYRAELRDDRGAVRATASVSTSAGAGGAVAVVSDVPRVDQRLDALLRSRSHLDAAVTQFATGQAFPADATHLSGLNAVVLDQFDSGSLSPAQVRALEDFVGLGGTLIEAGGAGARRTLGPLPGDLVPLQPSGVATAPLGPLAELSGTTTDATASVTTGSLAPGARVAVAAPDGTPLVVEGSYGAGDVVELTFDPLAAPFDGQLDLAGAAWGQALARGLSAASGSGSTQLAKLGFGGGPNFGGPPVGSGPGSAPGFPGYLGQALAVAPPAASPPFGLLAGLLVVYILVVSGLTYAVLRSVGRRGLLWVVVPAVAVVCTAGAYVAGFGTRGSDYQVVEVQVERLAPGGAVETAEYDGIFTPRRGDVTLSAPPGTIVTTAQSTFGPYLFGGGDPARISVANAPRVTFPNVAVWDLRPVQTLAVSHEGAGGGAGPPIEARLSLRSGRLQGQVVNHSSRTVRNLQIANANTQTTLAASLAPGATANVDLPLSTPTSGPLISKVGYALPSIVFGQATAASADRTLATLAATSVAVRPGEWALVGQVDPTSTLRIGGERPPTAGRALVVEPVRLQSADAAAGASPARVVSSYTTSGGTEVDVFEQAVPPGLTGHVAVTTTLLPTRPPTIAPLLEVYDWDAHTWRSAAGGTSSAVTSGEIGPGGVIRARVTSDEAQVSVTLSDAP